MCYSILVETDLKKLGHDFEAMIDSDAFIDIYEKRLENPKALYIPRGIDACFSLGATPAERKIMKLAGKYNDALVKELEAKIDEKRKTAAELDAKLKKKWFKTTQQKFDTTLRVIKATEKRLQILQSPINHGSPKDSRIMQYSYAPLIVREGGKQYIRPFRYQIRSRFAKTEPDRKINMFNVRYETVDQKTSWKPLFMENHAAVLYKGFYEWVEDPKTKKPAEIFFFPKGMDHMWTPALYEHWSDGEESINSFAILTMDPPQEIETMGHDRCPIFPHREFLPDWLNPKSCNQEFIVRNLEKKEPVEYGYHWVSE